MSNLTELVADSTAQELEVEEPVATTTMLEESSPLDARLEELDWLKQFEGPGLTKEEWRAISRLSR
jgi:hypothetical protein